MIAGNYQKKYNGYKEEIDRRLLGLIDGRQPASVYEPMRYVLKGSGKRLRAMLVLLACESVGGRAANAMDAAVALEILHNFTLVHDDIMDHAAVRRGRATVHKKWDDNVAILAGDEMIAQAYRSLLQTRNVAHHPLLESFTDAFIQVCEGQGLDKEFEGRRDVSLIEYLAMIQKKTGMVMSASAEIGALIGGGTRPQVNALRRFGEELGVAFQIQDDLLDVTGSADEFGKRIGGDIIEGKRTFLLLTAWEQSRGNDRLILRKVLQRNRLSGRSVPVVRDVFERTGALDRAAAEIRRRTRRAQRLLAKLENNSARAMLLWLSDQLLLRNS